MQQPDLSRAHWRKSSLSGSGASCVEVAFVDDAVAVRDTKDRDGGTLVFQRDDWKAFIEGVRQGKFDLD
ncbi:DUF397 domain-containing protein [Streptosporangium sp. NPDC000396]|uniref:DUF397 domain-containing protein n=1 Tax=Streptosporangium sp. NPDC000396 TaxID=3366185 RepID=UPI00368A3EE8